MNPSTLRSGLTGYFEGRNKRWVWVVLIGPTSGAFWDPLRGKDPLAGLEPVTEAKALEALKGQVKGVRVGEAVLEYLLGLASWLRSREEVRLGPSPRALLQVERLAQALALLEGRAFVIPEDVKRAFRAALPHRLLLKLEAELAGLSPEPLVEAALKAVPAPVEV